MSLSRLDQSGSTPVFAQDGCVWPPFLASSYLPLALTISAQGPPASLEPSPNPTPPLLQAHVRKKLALLLEVLKN